MYIIEKLNVTFNCVILKIYLIKTYSRVIQDLFKISISFCFLIMRYNHRFYNVAEYCK